MSIKKVIEIDADTSGFDKKTADIRTRLQNLASDASSTADKVYWLYYHTHFITQALLRNMKGTVLAQGIAIAQGMIWDAQTIKRLQAEATAAWQIWALSGNPVMMGIAIALEASIGSIIAMQGMSLASKLSNEQLQQQIELNQNADMYTNG